MSAPASWGLQPPSQPAAVRAMAWADQAERLAGEAGCSRLAYGAGRSYGDVCLNNGGALIRTAGLDRVIAYDPVNGILTAEAGLTFASIHHLVVPDGWFTPVTPGTSRLTLGGAVANDVHGKDHPTQGTLGRHVAEFVLWRSDRGRIVCRPSENAGLFRATIGGLGLTGLITQVTLRLTRIAGPVVAAVRAAGDFAETLPAAAREHRYAVAWIDASATGGKLGHALVTAGDFAPGEPAAPRRQWRVPPVFPAGLLNRATIDLLNRLRWRPAPGRQRLSPEQFFHPLDRLAGWNHLYGPRGFYQHQGVIPQSAGAEPIRDLLRALRRGGGASFVSVLKVLGPLESPGMMSFPREGLTLALDLPNTGQHTLKLLDEMDRIVVSAGGRIYPAKDARMSPATFRAGYPQWEAFARWADPAFSSSFWRRVTA